MGAGRKPSEAILGVFKLADRGVELRDAYDRAVAAAADPGSWDNCVRQYKKHKQKATGGSGSA